MGTCMKWDECSSWLWSSCRINYKAVFQIRIRRIPMFVGLLDPHPDPWFICTDPDPFINKQKMKNNLDFYCFVTFLRLFIFEESFKCTFKKEWEKTFEKINYFLLASWRSLTEPDSNPNQLVKGTDPRLRIRIRTTMSQIRNADNKLFGAFLTGNVYKLGREIR